VTGATILSGAFAKPCHLQKVCCPYFPQYPGKEEQNKQNSEPQLSKVLKDSQGFTGSSGI
jgi:hypothetical protein